MAQKSGILSSEDLRRLALPEEIQHIGTEATHNIWQAAQRIIQEQSEKIKALYQRQEAELLEKHQKALDTIDAQHKELVGFKQQAELLTRENKSLRVELDRKIGEISGHETHLVRLEEKALGNDHEVRRLVEEATRYKEQADYTQRRLDEANRQAQLEQQSLIEARTELESLDRSRERLQEQVKQLSTEVEQLRERVKAEYTRAAVAAAQTEEIRGSLKKSEQNIQELRHELQTTKESLSTEQKSRQETEKKAMLLSTQLSALEHTYKDSTNKLEQELNLSKSEVMSLRTRMIKAEVSLEPDKKAVERRETKLAMLAGAKIGAA